VRLTTGDDDFFHDIAGVLVIAEFNELSFDLIDNVIFDVVGSLQNQMLHDVVPKLTVT
jgi:hypothetical protein